MQHTGVEGQNVTHAHGLLEDEFVDRHGHHAGVADALGQHRTCQVHLSHDPATKDVAIGIDIGRHGDDFENQLLVFGQRLRGEVGTRWHGCRRHRGKGGIVLQLRVSTMLLGNTNDAGSGK